MRRFVLLVLLALFPVTGCGSSAAPPIDLLFVSPRDGDYAIYGVAAGGGHEHRVTKGRGDPSSPKGLLFAIEPAWSPNGRLIAFVSKRDGVSHVYVMNADGTGVRRLTHSRAEDDGPTWSPDGRRIAFAREGALFVVDSAGGPARRLGRVFAGRVADPAWSPDGKSIAFDYRPGDSQEIWVVGADGTHARQLTRLNALSGYPSWSPDGRRLAFQSNAQGGHFEIYTVAVVDGALSRETMSSIDTIEPAWSPDGKEIAFSRDGAIWTIDRAGKEHKLTSGDNDSAPAWRPAGTRSQE
jgi:TolB protein